MTTPARALAAAPRRVSQFWPALFWALFATLFAMQSVAQAPAAAGGAAPPPPAVELEKLVGPIALYPDDLVAIILPASTNPLQIVQADRFLETRKKDPKAPVDEKWDESVKALLNYPEVVKKMSADLDWTAALGEAVAADSGEVMAAVQAFRRKVNAAGNLKTDDKQKVVVEQEIIKIEQANPEVIYVPQYNPTTVVVYSAYPYTYYPAPYPVYYYPYPPGAAFAAGIVWGAAIGAVWSGGRYGCGWGGNEININRNTNINVGSGNVNVGSGNRPTQQGGGSQKWQSNKKPGQVSSSVGKTPSASTRVGDTRGGAGGARPSTQPAGGGAGAGGARPSTQPAGGASAGARDAGGSRAPSATPTSASRGTSNAFDSGGSARTAQANSSRGASSRSSMSSSAGARAGGGRGGGRR
jgi:hypothetical protein